MKRRRLAEADVVVIRKRLVSLHFQKTVGHLGGNLSSIDAISLIINEYCDDPRQFVLSKGHSALALYTALWFRGVISDADLDSALDDGTQLPAHTPFDRLAKLAIPFGTGSLGHGLSLSVGLALAHHQRRSDETIYCLLSDGEIQEGQTIEALGFAANQGLANLVVLIDGNGLQGFGTTEEVQKGRDHEALLRSFAVDFEKTNGHNLNDMRRSLDVQGRARPLVLWLDTVKGFGVLEIEGKISSHYWPLTQAQYDTAKGGLV